MLSDSRTKVIECESADEFLSQISPRAGHFYDYGPSTFIFRGHPDARFALVPSVFRNGILVRTARGWRPVGDWSNREQIEAEYQTLRLFFERSDAAGLPLPEDSQALRRLLFDGTHTPEFWPPFQLLSLLGLAQHYGVPTRLLDWSRSALKAAYFAAREAAVWHREPHTSPKDVTHLGVWAYSLMARDIDRTMPTAFSPEERIEVVTAPRAGNPNLHAQEGVFTLYRPGRMSPEEPVDRKPLNVVFAESRSSQQLLHFRLPIGQAPVLLRLLAKEGANAVSLFPGFGGVVAGLTEERYWRT